MECEEYGHHGAETLRRAGHQMPSGQIDLRVEDLWSELPSVGVADRLSRAQGASSIDIALL